MMNVSSVSEKQSTCAEVLHHLPAPSPLLPATSTIPPTGTTTTIIPTAIITTGIITAMVPVALEFVSILESGMETVMLVLDVVVVLPLAVTGNAGTTMVFGSVLPMTVRIINGLSMVLLTHGMPGPVVGTPLGRLAILSWPPQQLLPVLMPSVPILLTVIQMMMRVLLIPPLYGPPLLRCNRPWLVSWETSLERSGGGPALWN
jgi:hypothetical protein